VARSSQGLFQTTEQICSAGGKAQAFPMDLFNLTELPGQLHDLVRDFGPCDLLVNNAGMGYTATTTETPLSDWQRVLDLNLTAAFLAIQAVLPGMRQMGRGTIINVVSIAGKQAFPGWSAYCASKFGLLGLSHAVAQEERSHGIRVTAFCPGSVNTPIWDTPTVRADFDRSRMLQVDEVAESLVQIALMSPSAVVEEIVLMPAAGAF
jgi:short-subunit dehydrogenase